MVLTPSSTLSELTGTSNMERKTTQEQPQNIQDYIIGSVVSNYELSQLGFVSIRNEDGTAWADGHGQWGPYAGRRPLMYAEFLVLLARKEETTKNNSPDNGFFGLMNLKFTPCSTEAANIQIEAADSFDEAATIDDADDPTSVDMLPTLAELNSAPAADIVLLMVRCLMTSDLTFMYTLFKPDTLKDLAEVFEDLLKFDKEYTDSAWPTSIREEVYAGIKTLQDSTSTRD